MSLLLMKRRTKSVVSFVSVFFFALCVDDFGDDGKKCPRADPTGSLAPSSPWTRPSVEHESAHLLRQAHPPRSKEEARRVEFTNAPPFSSSLLLKTFSLLPKEKSHQEDQGKKQRPSRENTKTRRPRLLQKRRPLLLMPRGQQTTFGKTRLILL